MGSPAIQEQNRRKTVKTAARTLMVLILGGASAATASAGSMISINGEPTSKETAAVKRALGADYTDMSPFTVGHADLNGDHGPDLIFRTGNSDYCGSSGCATSALLATAAGYQRKAIDLAYSASDLIVLPTVHKGMHDLQFDGGTHRFKWDGAQYQ
jgi:hypothetical protein